MKTNDIFITDRITAVAPQICIWSAKKKCNVEDYGANAEIPPDSLVSIGAKKLISPERLKPFQALKYKAVSLLERKGIKFVSGIFFVPNEQMDDVTKTLENLRVAFEQAKTDFLTDFDVAITDWAQQNAQYSQVLANAEVSKDYVRSRLSFDWKAFNINVSANSNIEDDVKNIASSVYNDIAKTATEIYEDVFKGRRTVTHKALSPLRQLEDKLNSWAFVDPFVGQVADLIHDVLSVVPPKGNITGTALHNIIALLCLLQTPHTLAATVNSLQESDVAESLWEAVGNSTIPQDEPMQEEDVADDSVIDVEDEVSIPVIPIAQPKLNSMGLW